MRSDDAAGRIDALLADPRILAARRHLERSDDATVALQTAITQIAAPTGGEARRAAHVAGLLREAGLQHAGLDGAGNALGWYGDGAPGAGDGGVVLTAHLDTVFGPEVDVSVRRGGDRLVGPGISDNGRGLAALVALAGALRAGNVALDRPLLFAATVGEEGAGNLRGVKYLLGAGERGTGDAAAAPPIPRPCALIALDGAGISRVVHRAVGSRRYRVTFRGPGGHSWAAFGVANPAAAVGHAIGLLSERPTPHTPRTTCAVVGLGGGTGLNSIPAEAWVDLDLRSESAAALAQRDREVHRALAAARDAENRARTPGSAPLECEARLIGERPSGETPPGDTLVRIALAATRALGIEPELAAASTDASAAIALGVPAIALGAGGRAGDTHLPGEWYENHEGPLGIMRALLVTVAAAGTARGPGS
jgi:acetylornithine deacetylase/succinyl-diaminopimelate desuccinylase-like protein